MLGISEINHEPSRHVMQNTIIDPTKGGPTADSSFSFIIHPSVPPLSPILILRPTSL